MEHNLMVETDPNRLIKLCEDNIRRALKPADIPELKLLAESIRNI
jgi:hypothetical protein